MLIEIKTRSSVQVMERLNDFVHKLPASKAIFIDTCISDGEELFKAAVTETKNRVQIIHHCAYFLLRQLPQKYTMSLSLNLKKKS